jgi:ribosomal protein L11 methyltransferase
LKWQEVSIRVHPAQVPAAEAILYRDGAGGLLEEESGDLTVLKAYFRENKPLAELIRGWDELLRDVPPGTAPLFSLCLSDEEDWADGWKRFYHALRVGKHLVIKPSWEPFNPGAGDLIVEIDPGMAFGSGYHATTQLCLELMERFIRRDDQVLDLGTGSGILAIAAARLGASGVLAADIDPAAVETAEKNMKLNAPGFPFKVIEGGVEAIRGKFNVISANLTAETLAELAGFFPGLLLPGGHLIAGGITVEKKKMVLTAFLDAGLSLAFESSRDDWCSLVVKK